MRTLTKHTIILQEPETSQAIVAFLRERNIPVQDAGKISIKWSKGGEATISFEVEEIDGHPQDHHRQSA